MMGWQAARGKRAMLATMPPAPHWLAALALAAPGLAQTPAPTAIPRTWEEAGLSSMELPNAATGAPARHVPAEFYYAVPATVLYRTYPVYHPDREPPGYVEELRKQAPEPTFDASKLTTEAAWVAAGEQVFHWPTGWRESTPESRARFAEEFRRVPVPTTADGILPFYVYTVREVGKLEIGTQSCAMCHTRVMPDGAVIVGAQGNLPFDRQFAESVAGGSQQDVAGTLAALFGMPASSQALPYPPATDGKSLATALRAIPPGVLARHGSSAFAPVQVPDLIGIRERKYLDRTGLVRHRGPADLMRYAALNQGIDFLSAWQDFVPAFASVDAVPAEQWPADAPPRDEVRRQIGDPAEQFRYSDEQLYALTQYLYSLQPPENPNTPTALSERGREVFAAEDCAKCHPAPLYTSNELTPVRGFRVPEALRATERIRSRGVDTDPTLALQTRRGTGFYKVPSLLGVWYRGPFGHSGAVATLEDWFDPRRLRDDYVPTGWNPGGSPRAVPGHEFGLDLEPADRQALLAFLRTL
jgi:hypothetical protein